MRHWFKDQHMRSLLKNSSYLGASRAVAAVASLITLAFTGRALGVEMFGLLILIHSYVEAASSLTKFQSWQLVVRYGGDILVTDDPTDFQTATGFALGLDLASGFLGMVVAMVLLPFIGHWFGIPDKYLTIAILYCLLLPTMASMTASGVLRALDRFDLISWSGSVYPILRAIIVAVAWLLDWPFEAYIVIWFVTDLIGDLYMAFLTWRELKRRGLLKGIRPILWPKSLPGAWRFATHVNLTASLMGAWGPLARLIVGGLLGPAAAALYRVASNLADAVQKPTDLLSRAYYPEVARMDLSTKGPWKLMLRGSAIAAGVGVAAMLIMIVAGQPLINLIFGDNFAGAYPPLMVLMVVAVLLVISFPFAPMLYALDRPDAPLFARVVGTILYLIIVAPFAWQFGLNGAAAAFVIGNAAMVAVLAIQLRNEYTRVRGW
jgi:O-antigen/teichoic acid export membrane protein